MQAVKKSRVKTKVVNAAFPDLVNPALGKIGLAPTVGIGNIDNLLSCSRIVAARMFDAPLRAVTIYMVAPHFFSYYVSRFGNDGGAPYYIKVMVDDTDVTQKINREEFLANLVTIGRRPAGVQANPIVASSACKIIMGILFDTRELGHAPGPNGLPGGYPVKLKSDGVEVFIPEDLTLEEAVRINTEAQSFDGVEAIHDDGTVIITDKSAAIFKKLLDFDCKSYAVQDCETKAKELNEKFNNWAEKFK